MRKVKSWRAKYHPEEESAELTLVFNPVPGEPDDRKFDTYADRLAAAILLLNSGRASVDDSGYIVVE